jgi:hypothetical protein
LVLNKDFNEGRQLYGRASNCTKGMLDFSCLLYDVIKDLEGPLWPFLRDYACGGDKRRLSLFRDKTKCSELRYTQADLAIPFAERYVGFILEDDAQKKNALSPKALFGNAFATINSNYLIDKNSPPLILPITRAVLVQCVDLERVSKRSRKLEQFHYIEKDVNESIGNGCGAVARYFLIAGTHRDFREGPAGERLRGAVQLSIHRFVNELHVEDGA